MYQPLANGRKNHDKIALKEVTDPLALLLISLQVCSMDCLFSQ
ncbi:MAG: hypothetical protein [Olavius algarvensis Delta 4 endosymbiont]|nr:MAG: hypothetical protein [Olavius algarvensis Delta 4 endosymbiont]